MTILDTIKEYKLQEVIDRKQKRTLYDLQQDILNHPSTRGFANRLVEKKDKNQIGLIAEIKKASPSKGIIRHDFNVAELAKAYEQGGATCLSVLTDTPSFQGHDDYLHQAKIVTRLPVLRKDFMFDIYQIFESRALGADCILLIMACLDDQQAIDLENVAIEQGMDVLIETHNQDELERALKNLKSNLIGINNRNLHNFVTDLAVSKELATLIPSDKLIISESGIRNANDIKELQEYGINSFLVGESLMRHDDVTQATQDLLS